MSDVVINPFLTKLAAEVRDEVGPDKPEQHRAYEGLIDNIYDSNGVLKDFREDYYLLGVEVPWFQRLITWLITKSLYAEERAILIQEARRLQIQNDRELIANEVADRAKKLEEEERAAKAAKEKAGADKLKDSWKTVAIWKHPYVITMGEKQVRVYGHVDLMVNRLGWRKLMLVSITRREDDVVVPDVLGRYDFSFKFLQTQEIYNLYIQPWLEGIRNVNDLQGIASVTQLATFADGKFEAVPIVKAVVFDSHVDKPKKKAVHVNNRTVDIADHMIDVNDIPASNLPY